MCRRQHTILQFEQMLEMRGYGKSARHFASIRAQARQVQPSSQIVEQIACECELCIF